MSAWGDNAWADDNNISAHNYEADNNNQTWGGGAYADNNGMMPDWARDSPPKAQASHPTQSQMERQIDAPKTDDLEKGGKDAPTDYRVGPSVTKKKRSGRSKREEWCDCSFCEKLWWGIMMIGLILFIVACALLDSSPDSTAIGILVFGLVFSGFGGWCVYRYTCKKKCCKDERT